MSPFWTGVSWYYPLKEKKLPCSLVYFLFCTDKVTNWCTGLTSPIQTAHPCADLSHREENQVWVFGAPSPCNHQMICTVQICGESICTYTPFPVICILCAGLLWMNAAQGTQNNYPVTSPGQLKKVGYWIALKTMSRLCEISLKPFKSSVLQYQAET